MEGKRRNTKLILIVLIAVVLIAILISILFIWKPAQGNPITNLVHQVVSLITGGPAKNINTLDQGSSSTGSSSGGSSGGSGGGGGSSSVGSTGMIPGCTKEKASYSMEDVNDISECITYQDSVCIEKNVTCSINIVNREASSTTYFNMKVDFTPGNDSQEKKFYLNASESMTFTGSTYIISEGEDGLANKEINCFFSALEDPYKENC